MKKYFFNLDGTIKLIPAIILVDVITFLLLFLIFMNLFKSQDLNPRITTTTTTATTTTIRICKNCYIKFNRENMVMEPNESYPLEDLMDLKDVDIHNVKFSISNMDLASIGVLGGKTSLVAKDTLGTFTLTAKYLDLEEIMTITISTLKLESIKFNNNSYYVYVDETVPFAVTTSPVGYNIDNLTFSIEDTSIAEVVDNKKILGKTLGMTKLSINNNGSIITANVYVVKNKIIIKTKEDYLYQEKEIIEYSDEMVEILLQIEGNDKTYTNEDVTPIVYDMGNFTTELNFVSKSTSLDNAYIYRLKFTSNTVEKKEDNYSLIEFKLSDGTKKELKIERK